MHIPCTYSQFRQLYIRILTCKPPGDKGPSSSGMSATSGVTSMSTAGETTAPKKAPWKTPQRKTVRFLSAISQTIISDAFLCMKKFVFWISQKLVPVGPIDKHSALVKIMAWRQIGDEPIWNNTNQIHWRIYAALGGDELNVLSRKISKWGNTENINPFSLWFSNFKYVVGMYVIMKYEANSGHAVCFAHHPATK